MDSTLFDDTSATFSGCRASDFRPINADSIFGLHFRPQAARAP